jgi:hypothetical protein
MLINQTEISIRERGKRELFDLALHVARRHFAPLVGAIICGVLPFAAINAWVLSGIPEDMYGDLYGTDTRIEYVTYMTLLVFIEAPLATSLMTLYLGQVLFRSRPTARQLFRDFLSCSPQLIWYQGIIRLVAVALVAAALNRWDDYDGFPEFLIWCVAIWGLLVRGTRPYLSEVILLERNPRRASKATAMTTSRRNAALHAGFGGDSFVQMIGAGLLAFLAVGSLWLTLAYFRAMFFNALEFDRASLTVLLPIALWITVWFLAIVRFLGYLDLRIRREGWEVELRVRAEAAAMTKSLA